MANELAASPAATGFPPNVKLPGMASTVRSFAIFTAFYRYTLSKQTFLEVVVCQSWCRSSYDSK